VQCSLLLCSGKGDVLYSRINSTKSPVSGGDNVSKPRLMAQVGRVREVACGSCVSAVRAGNVCCKHVTEVGGS
jgi:hypothetical protein